MRRVPSLHSSLLLVAGIALFPVMIVAISMLTDDVTTGGSFQLAPVTDFGQRVVRPDLTSKWSLGVQALELGHCCYHRYFGMATDDVRVSPEPEFFKSVDAAGNDLPKLQDDNFRGDTTFETAGSHAGYMEPSGYTVGFNSSTTDQIDSALNSEVACAGVSVLAPVVMWMQLYPGQSPASYKDVLQDLYLRPVDSTWARMAIEHGDPVIYASEDFRSVALQFTGNPMVILSRNATEEPQLLVESAGPNELKSMKSWDVLNLKEE